MLIAGKYDSRSLRPQDLQVAICQDPKVDLLPGGCKVKLVDKLGHISSDCLMVVMVFWLFWKESNL